MSSTKREGIHVHSEELNDRIRSPKEGRKSPPRQRCLSFCSLKAGARFFGAAPSAGGALEGRWRHVVCMFKSCKFMSLSQHDEETL